MIFIKELKHGINYWLDAKIVTVKESKTGVKNPKMKNEGNHTTANTTGAKREEIDGNGIARANTGKRKEGNTRENGETKTSTNWSGS